MEFFQWLREVVCRLYHRFIQSLTSYRPLSHDNESTMAGSSVSIFTLVESVMLIHFQAF